MKRDFIVNFSLLLLVNIIVKPAWLFGDLMVQRMTGESYGIFFSLFNLSLLLNMFLDLGTSNYNNRKVAGNPKLFHSYFAHIGTLRLLLSSIYIGLLLSVGFIMGVSAFEVRLLIILGLGQVLMSSLLFLRSNITALALFKWDSFLSVLDKVVMIILLVVAYSMNKIDIENFAWIQLLGYGFTAVVAAVVLISYKANFSLSWSGKFKKSLIRQSLPYAIIGILMASYSYIDAVMLRQLLDDGHYHNTIYAQSFRILMAGNNYAYLVAILLLPMFSKLLSNKQSTQSLLRLSGSLMFWFTTVFAVVAYCYAEQIISLLYGLSGQDYTLWERFQLGIDAYSNGEDLKYSSAVFSLLIIGIVPMSFNYTYGALLTAGGKMKLLNSIALFSLVANVILNLFFIPIHGAFGAAIASVSTQGLAAVLQLYWSYKENEHQLSWDHVLRFSALLAGLFVLILLSISNFQMSWVLALVALYACLGVFVLKVVSVENIKSLMLKKS